MPYQAIDLLLFFVPAGIHSIAHGNWQDRRRTLRSWGGARVLTRYRNHRSHCCREPQYHDWLWISWHAFTRCQRLERHAWPQDSSDENDLESSRVGPKTRLGNVRFCFEALVGPTGLRTWKKPGTFSSPILDDAKRSSLKHQKRYHLLIYLDVSRTANCLNLYVCQFEHKPSEFHYVIY